VSWLFVMPVNPSDSDSFQHLPVMVCWYWIDLMTLHIHATVPMDIRPKFSYGLVHLSEHMLLPTVCSSACIRSSRRPLANIHQPTTSKPCFCRMLYWVIVLVWHLPSRGIILKMT